MKINAKVLFVISALTLLILSACTSSDRIGKATEAVIADPPDNPLCLFAMQTSKHDKLCKMATTYPPDPDALSRDAKVDYFLKNHDGTTTDNLLPDGTVDVVVFPDAQVTALAGTELNAGGEVIKDFANKIRLVINKPLNADPLVKYPLYRYAFHATDQRNAVDNTIRLWRKIDMTPTLEANSIPKITGFDSLVGAADPLNPNNFYFDIKGASAGEVAAIIEIVVDDNAITTDEIAPLPEETHVVIFQCECTGNGCLNTDTWICNPRYTSPTGTDRTFGDGDVRWVLEKVGVRQAVTAEAPSDPGGLAS